MKAAFIIFITIALAIYVWQVVYVPANDLPGSRLSVMIESLPPVPYTPCVMQDTSCHVKIQFECKRPAFRNPYALINPQMEEYYLVQGK